MERQEKTILQEVSYMDHKAKRVLAVTLATFTATSPCLTSAAEVDPTAILAEKNLLKVIFLPSLYGRG